ncbi:MULTISPECIES: hypothetical protein [unclassified Paraburkholderia]|uniref:hypothetical protein n=1 Tax=unclassified Paraburkholderia TaxID=2615204 RepID=UPI002AB1107A|nr:MULTISPECIES: hypothetical protein [unclassified Paraburkholderia]
MTPKELIERIRYDREEDYQARGVTMLIFSIVVFLPIDVFALNRPFISALAYSIALAALLLVPFTIVSLIDGSLKFSKGSGLVQHLIKYQSAILQVIAAGAMYYTIGASISDFYRYLKSPLSGHTPTALVTALITLGAGALLFYIRSKWRLLYGLTEITVGVIVASYRVIDAETQAYQHTEFYLAILTAGVYLVVRGMDNVQQAQKKSRDNRVRNAAVEIEAVTPQQ